MLVNLFLIFNLIDIYFIYFISKILLIQIWTIFNKIQYPYSIV